MSLGKRVMYKDLKAKGAVIGIRNGRAGAGKLKSKLFWSWPPVGSDCDPTSVCGEMGPEEGGEDRPTCVGWRCCLGSRCVQTRTCALLRRCRNGRRPCVQRQPRPRAGEELLTKSGQTSSLPVPCEDGLPGSPSAAHTQAVSQLPRGGEQAERQALTL